MSCMRPGLAPSLQYTAIAPLSPIIVRRPMLSTSSAATPSWTRSRLGASETNETKLFIGATRAVPAWHGARERVTAAALQQLREGLARELACTGRACRRSAGRTLCCIHICGSKVRPRMRERLREAMHGDVMFVVGRCGALEQRIAAACDLPVRRVALFSDEYSWHSI